MTNEAARFYIAGGTIPRDSPSYVLRQADVDLFDGLTHGQFCYVLTSRQMGKSSLMVRTMSRLRDVGVAVGNLDLTAVGQNLDPEQWYDGLLNLLARSLDLEEELEEFWLRSDRYSPLQRWTLALRDVVLAKIPGQVVLFVDEIDAVRSLPFSADEFFAAIRECYNRRAHDPEYNRITFCLMGVATPSDLIQDVRTTPFNIGHRIELTDFTEQEAEVLASGLGPTAWQLPTAESPDGTNLSNRDLTHLARLATLRRILYWTGGHPYLTQRLCIAVADTITSSGRPVSTDRIDRLCRELFLSTAAQERDDNLIFVRERILRSEGDIATLLDLYAKVLRSRSIPNSDSNPRLNTLKLAGIIKPHQRVLRVRNRIYARVFNQAWIKDNLPNAEVMRQRIAYRRGLLRASSFAAIVFIAMAVLSITAVQQARRAEKATSTAKRSEKSLKVALNQAKLDRESALTAANRATAAEKQAEKAEKHAVRAGKQAVKAGKQAERAGKQAERAGKQETKAKQDALVNLRNSYLAQAQAMRRSGRPGQRFGSLEALKKAAAIGMDSALRLTLRNEAIADMALPIDLAKRNPWDGWPHGTVRIALDSNFEHYARCDNLGNVTIGSVSTHKDIIRLPGNGSQCDTLYPPLFSPNGRVLAVVYAGDNIVLWDVKRGKPVWSGRGAGRDFSSDGRLLAIGERDGEVHVYDATTWRQRCQFHLTVPAAILRFCPGVGSLLAVGGVNAGTLVVCNPDNGATVKTISLEMGLECMDWSPDGKTIATGENGAGFIINIWDSASGRKLFTMRDHEQSVLKVAFNHGGRLLASTSWDGTLRLWDPLSGKPLLVTTNICGEDQGNPPQFSPDDRRLAWGFDGAKVWMWDLPDSRVCRTFRRLGDGIVGGLQFSPDGTILASSGAGVQLWDVDHGVEIGTVPSGSCLDVVFTSDRASIITYGTRGLLQWPIASASGTLRIGPPSSIDDALIGGPHFCISKDGSTLALLHRLTGPDTVHVLDLRGKPQVVFKPYARLNTVDVSRDGRWVAAGTFGSRTVFIWDVRSGNLVKTLHFESDACVNFSPDGRWLITGTRKEYTFWDLGMWKSHYTILRERGSTSVVGAAYSRDCSVLAIAYSDHLLRLLSSTTLEELATLESPNTGNLSALALSFDGCCLAAASSNGTVIIWNLKQVRSSLVKMGLDWEPAPMKTRGAGLERGPIRASVIGEDKVKWYRRVIDHLKAVLAVSPNNWISYYNLAYVYVAAPLELQRPEAALPLISKGLDLNPNALRMYNTLGMVLYRLGRYADAVKALNRSITVASGSTYSTDLFFLAMCNMKMGDRKDARINFDSAVTLSNSLSKPDMDEAEELDWFRAEAEEVLGVASKGN